MITIIVCSMEVKHLLQEFKYQPTKEHSTFTPTGQTRMATITSMYRLDKHTPLQLQQIMAIIPFVLLQEVTPFLQFLVMETTLPLIVERALTCTLVLTDGVFRDKI